MKRVHSGTVFISLAAAGFVGLIAILVAEIGTFHDSVLDWARRDLGAQTALAAGEIGDAIAAEDFRRIHAFGDKCAAEGVRVTILSSLGGVKFDSESGASKGGPGARPEVDAAIRDGVGSTMRTSSVTGRETLFCARRIGDSVVRLGIPSERVFAPVRKSRLGLLLAGLVGAFGLTLVFLFVERLLVRVRELAAERDRKEAQLAELRRAEAFRREFVSDVTHEIRTPLTGILGAVELLSGETPVTEDDRRALLGMLRKESMRLNDLAQDILSLGRLEHAETAADARASFAQVDLADVAAGVCERFRAKAAASRVALSAFADGPCVAECDARLVEQALSNLVENALRHSGSPDVAISLSRRDGMAEFAVEDHGVGIAPGHSARVFERFYRIDKGRSRDLGGTGLGLAIVKHVAQLHGGGVSLSSEPGRGARFAFTVRIGDHDQT